MSSCDYTTSISTQHRGKMMFSTNVNIDSEISVVITLHVDEANNVKFKIEKDDIEEKVDCC